MTGRKVCVVPACTDHRDDPTWLHVVPLRRTVVTAHLQPYRRVAA